MFQLRLSGLLTGIGVLLLSIILPPVTASAQAPPPPVRPPLNLTTSPLPLNVITKPGQTVTADIRVKNNGNRPEKIKVELLKFGAGGETGTPKLLDREPTDIYFDWVTFSENAFTAEPAVWKTIKMTVKAPPSAAFGYYMAVVFSRADPDKPTGGASGVEGGVASLVLLNVDAPGAKREAKLVELTASQKVYEFLPANFNVKVRNSGNVHVSPSGSIFISQGGKEVGVLEFNTQRGYILPQTNRVFDNTWNSGFPRYEDVTEDGKTSKKLVWDFEQLQNVRIGKFTATLVAVYDDGQRDVPIEAVVSFWVIPWRILGGLLLLFLLISIGVWAILRGLWRGVHRPKAGDDNDDDEHDTDRADPVGDATEPETSAEEPVTEPANKIVPIDDLPTAPVLPAGKQKASAAASKTDSKIDKKDAANDET